jgi:hypothetical protein
MVAPSRAWCDDAGVAPRHAATNATAKTRCLGLAAAISALRWWPAGKEGAGAGMHGHGGVGFPRSVLVGRNRHWQAVPIPAQGRGHQIGVTIGKVVAAD